MLDDVHMKMYWEWLQWQYANLTVAFADPNVVKIVARDVGTEEGLYCIFELQDLLKRSEVLILPIHSEAPLHCTAIEVRSPAGSTDVTEVRYFDWLGNVGSNRAYAEKVWAAVTEGRQGPLPQTFNYFKQAPGSNDCGVLLLWLQENNLREKRGEGRDVLYPDPQDFRQRLDKLYKFLGKQKETWLLEESSGHKPKAVISLPGLERPAKEVAKAVLKAFQTSYNKEEWYVCGNCRWTSTKGEGCTLCNPRKKEAYKKRTN